MAHSVSSQRVDDPSKIASLTQTQTPVANPALEKASAPTSNAPNLKSKSLKADLLAARHKTGLAKKLEESFVNRSATNTFANLNQNTANTEHTVATPGTLEDVETADRTLRKRKFDKEYPALKRRLVSNSRPDAPRSPYRPPSNGMTAIHSVKKATDDSIALAAHSATPPPQHEIPASSIRPLSTVKEKVEGLFSPEVRLAQLMRGIEWTSFGNSFTSDELDPFNRLTYEPDSPPRNPRVGEKRKATDEMNLGMQPKRLRFSEDELSRASESPINQSKEKFKPYPKHEKEIDRLSKELAKDYEPAYEFMSINSGATGVSTEQKKSEPNLVNIGDLGESVRSARAGNTIWFTTNTDQSASISAQTTLKLLLDANEKKINKRACNSLQELFALIPAGAMLGTEFFDQALRRAVSELSLSAEQWREVDNLYGQYDQLHLLSNPRSTSGFKELLGRIIAIKDSTLQGDNLALKS
jgi:hypothetical protein